MLIGFHITFLKS